MFAVFDCLQGPLGFVTEVFLLLREAQNIPALSGEPYLPLAPSPQRQRHRSVCCEPPGGRTGALCRRGTATDRIFRGGGVTGLLSSDGCGGIGTAATERPVPAQNIVNLFFFTLLTCSGAVGVQVCSLAGRTPRTVHWA